MNHYKALIQVHITFLLNDLLFVSIADALAIQWSQDALTVLWLFVRQNTKNKIKHTK